MKKTSFITQAGIFGIILLISHFLAKLSPIPMPASVIGLILLFAGLCLGIIKLEQVEDLAQSLIGVLAFLFVPSGVSLMTSLDIMKASGVQIIFLIAFWTVIAMLIIGYVGQAIEWLKSKAKAKNASTQENH